MKLRGKTPRFKRQRRLLTELPGMGKAGAMERRPYPPGEHGQKRKKYSDYGLQLEEKQKILYHYGMREKQLRRFVELAKRKASTNWVSTLVGLLELRLDNVVFRLGFAQSIPAAKQLISHRKVLVNNKYLSIRSAILKPGDQISLKPAAYDNQVYLQAKQSPRLPLPNFLDKQEQSQGDIGKITDVPNLEHIPFPFEPAFFTGYYALKGVK